MRPARIVTVCEECGQPESRHTKDSLRACRRRLFLDDADRWDIEIGVELDRDGTE